MRPGAEATIDLGPARRRRTPPRLLGWTSRLSPDAWAMVAIAGAVIVAYLPYLLGVFEANPLGPRSGLAHSVITGPLGGSPTIDPNNGFISQALSHRAMLDLVHLHLPWWNPYEGTGAPLAGEMQSAALFPPTLLTLISNGQMYEHMLLEIVAGIATFLLLRRLSVNRWAAAAAGIAFALNGTFAWLSHATVNPIAFLPLLLLGIELAYAAALEGRRGGWWLIAVSLALSLYAGFPEVAYIDGLLGVFWLVWRCGSAPRDRLRALIVKAFAGALGGALLSAPLAIAALDYVSHGNLGLHGSTTLGSDQLPSQAFPQLVLPYVYGPIFDFTGHRLQLAQIWGAVGGYLNTSLILFGLLGLVGRRHRGLRIALLIWIVLAIARMYGEPPLLGHVLGILPEMSRVAFFRYGNASLELAIVVLAALGIDDVARAPQPRRRLLVAAGASLVVVAVAAIGSRSLIGQLEARFSQRPYFALAVAWGALVALAIGATAALRSARARIRLLSAVLALDALVLFVVPEFSAPRSVSVDTAPVAYLRSHLGNSRYFTLGPLAPNYGSYFGVASLNINDLPIPSAFSRYIHTRLDQVVDPTVFVGNYGGRSFLATPPATELERNLAGYRQAGVKYVLTPAGQALPPASFRLVFRSRSTWIYELSGSKPYLTASGTGCTIASAENTSARVSCAAAATLVRRETYMPGWSATVDGRSVPIRRTDGVFQSISVPAGTHVVSFAYAPPYIVWGLVGLVLGVGWLWLGPRLERPRPRDAASAGP